MTEHSGEPVRKLIQVLLGERQDLSAEMGKYLLLLIPSLSSQSFPCRLLMLNTVEIRLFGEFPGPQLPDFFWVRVHCLELLQFRLYESCWAGATSHDFSHGRILFLKRRLPLLAQGAVSSKIKGNSMSFFKIRQIRWSMGVVFKKASWQQSLFFFFFCIRSFTWNFSMEQKVGGVPSTLPASSPAEG